MTSGKLRVIVERADIFIDTEVLGKMDPYVVFEQRQKDNMQSFKHTT